MTFSSGACEMRQKKVPGVINGLAGSGGHRAAQQKRIYLFSMLFYHRCICTATSSSNVAIVIAPHTL
eukprot:5232229-Pleurochrysis_carterae.AAC.2